MKILFAHNEYGRPSGEEHALESIAELLRNHGHSVDWFCRSSAEIQSSLHKLQAFFSGVYSHRSRVQMTKVLSKTAFDVVHVQNLFPFLSPSILAPCRDRKIPIVMRCPNYRLFCPSGLHLSKGDYCERCLGGKEYWCVLRNCEGDHFKSLGYALRNVTARLTGAIIDRVKIFIVLSEFQKRRFISQGISPGQIEILPNMVPFTEHVASADDADWVSFVGRASPEKGIEDFLETARQLPEIPFVVAGATERMPHLLARSSANVRWLGFLSGDALESVYSKSRIVVMPSRCFEGFPNVVAHAMMAARPVVASRLGAMPEIVEEGRSGLMYDAADTTALTKSILQLYPDRERCIEMGRVGRQKAMRDYSPAVIYKRLMEIYNKATA